ncbi:MAG: hypothetical protein LBV60_04775 [Streptomyces sp.]|nr:hypothetical protein [Streptomyces sp.]
MTASVFPRSRAPAGLRTQGRCAPTVLADGRTPNSASGLLTYDRRALESDAARLRAAYQALMGDA